MYLSRVIPHRLEILIRLFLLGENGLVMRKVRCEGAPQVPGNDSHPEPRCVNCQRLGFQCRWQVPTAGEDYTPPPKRRRAPGRRRVVSSHNDHELPQQQLTVTRDVQQSDAGPATLMTGSDSTTGQLLDETLDLFGGFLFGTDFGSVSGGFDLNSAGEGLDFVPLPAVDNDMLQDLNLSTPLPDWPAPSSADALSKTPPYSGSDTVDPDGSHSSIDPNNRRLIQHYLDVMKGYAKVDDHAKDDNNLFISAFTRSLYFPPLFHAILAFSASHLAMEDESYANQANAFVTLAGRSFETFRCAETCQVDGLLSALFVRVKTVHMVGGSVDTFLSLISAAADIVSTKRDELALDTEPSLTRRIIVRLAILDARATYHRIGRGQLVHLIQEIPAFSALFARHLAWSASTGALFNLLRADILRMKVAELDTRLHAQMENEFVTETPIRTIEVKSLYDDIEYEIDQWNGQMSQRMDISTDIIPGDEVLSSLAFGYNIVLSALHSALVYLYSVYPLPSFNLERSISVVLQCQLRISNDPSRATSPSSILPSSIFMVGLMTSDPVHRHWILQLLKTGERWGVYVKKARQLLEAMLREPGQPDIRDMMDRVTGRFVI
ncbi:hypothetical protein CCM_04748 [Cordyceps militaris CM01]|uniref:Zn(2)-C6 fungal-type domain-containing protein n=1 Tax=Cordyceps militaris (strain CM01) TaxID=983644 RepID=G3JD48_CORMM|nr:uncharacterized protein CCM_04748 [Cordyceps militaris CM01]EGX93374.1 hypothetical protein CCM_04748 [Cordyceps militaris CM01]